uniref:Thymus, brain and testes associated n=1 Tax=Myripristis murdjan TaxID=586833 RepID=A0A667XV03_9TELE
MSHSPDSQRTSGERSSSHVSQVPFTSELTKMVTKSSPRFGTLSHHSFFSRHNPHPHRVTHIQGEHVQDSMGNICRASFALNGMFLCMLHVQDPPEEGFGRRKTQYSAQTGRIIPPSSKAYQRRSYSQRLAYPQPFHDQELMVLELLCQILQTDSLSLVQQWLLLAGQREKDLVMGLIQQALENIGGHQGSFQHVRALHPCTSLPAQGPSFGPSWRQTRRTRSEWSSYVAM